MTQPAPFDAPAPLRQTWTPPCVKAGQFLALLSPLDSGGAPRRTRYRAARSPSDSATVAGALQYATIGVTLDIFSYIIVLDSPRYANTQK